MQSFRLILSSALVLALVACSGSDVPTLTLTVRPAKVEVAGGAFATIEVRGTSGDAAIMDQSEITVTTDYASFEETYTEQTLTLYVEGGKATTKLYSPNKPGKATVTARFIDPYQVEVTATETVEFFVPPVANLEFSCSAKNIGALVEASADMHIRCDATPYTSDRKVVANAKVNFLTEAGGFSPIYQDSEIDARVLFSYNPRQGGKQPKDVNPVGAEPSWTDPANNQIRNPRDGLVTLVAYVESPNEGFQGEPYVDENDNGEYDLGEPYFDANDNGVWDDQQETHIWKMTKILWTGTAREETSSWTTTGGTGTSIARKFTRTFNFEFLDVNYNVLASNSATDQLYWAKEEGAVGFVGSQQIAFGGGSSPYGMDIDPVTHMLRNPGQEGTYKRGANYSVTLRNDNENVDGDPPKPIPEPYQVFAEVTRSIETNDEGAPDNQITERMPVSAYGILD